MSSRRRAASGTGEQAVQLLRADPRAEIVRVVTHLLRVIVISYRGIRVYVQTGPRRVGAEARPNMDSSRSAVGGVVQTCWHCYAFWGVH
jgi:hypothetical protein